MTKEERTSIAAVFLFLPLVLLGGCSGLFTATVTDPVDAFMKTSGIAAAADTRIERILLDFNNDGNEDMAVSMTPAGGEPHQWDIYLRDRAGRYAHAGSMQFDPPDVCIEPLDRATTRVLAFSRHRRNVVLLEYLLSKEKLRLRSRRTAAPGEEREIIAGTHCNVFRGNVEFCALGDYQRSRNCLWKRRHF